MEEGTIFDPHLPDEEEEDALKVVRLLEEYGLTYTEQK